MKWWLWIAWWFLFSVRHSRLYQVNHEKKHETSAGNSPIHIYINKVNSVVVFKIKEGYS